MSFLDQIDPLKHDALEAFGAASNLAELEKCRVQFLGANGSFTALLKQLGSLSREEKPAAGKRINEAKQVLALLSSTLDSHNLINDEGRGSC